MPRNKQGIWVDDLLSDNSSKNQYKGFDDEEKNDSDKNKSKFMDIENYKNIKSVKNNVQFIAWLLIINLTCILCYIIYQGFN